MLFVRLLRLIAATAYGDPEGVRVLMRVRALLLLFLGRSGLHRIEVGVCIFIF